MSFRINNITLSLFDNPFELLAGLLSIDNLQDVTTPLPDVVLKEMVVSDWHNGVFGECNICLEQYKEDDHLITLLCDHRFHYDCIQSWFREHCTCPICRADQRELSKVYQPNAAPEPTLNAAPEPTLDAVPELPMVSFQDPLMMMLSFLNPMMTYYQNTGLADTTTTATNPISDLFWVPLPLPSNFNPDEDSDHDSDEDSNEDSDENSNDHDSDENMDRDYYYDSSISDYDEADMDFDT